MNTMNIFLIVCTIILGIASIVGGKRKTGAEYKGLFYLVVGLTYLTLAILLFHIHAALVTFVVFCIVFCVTFVMIIMDPDTDTSEEKKLIEDLREKLEKARRK